MKTKEQTPSTETNETTVPRETTQPKKERGDSPTYTIKSFGKVIKKMQKAKMVTEQEYLQLSQLHKNVVQRWIIIGLEI